MSRRGVSGWMFLLVPAHPGSPGQRAVKRSCVCVVYERTYGDDIGNTVEENSYIFSLIQTC